MNSCTLAAHACIFVKMTSAVTCKTICHTLVKWLQRRMLLSAPSICLSWLSGKVTELNLFVNDLPQLSMSASGEFVILCPQRQQEGRAGLVDRKLMMLGNCRPMGFRQFDSLLVPISGSIKPSKGPHSGLYLGQHRLQNSIRLCQVRTDWRVNSLRRRHAFWTGDYEHGIGDNNLCCRLNTGADWNYLLCRV